MEKRKYAKSAFLLLSVVLVIYVLYPKTIYSKIEKAGFLKDIESEKIKIEVIEKERAFADGKVIYIDNDKLPELMELIGKYKVTSRFSLTREYKKQVYIFNFYCEDNRIGTIGVGRNYFWAGKSREYIPVGSEIDLNKVRDLVYK